MARMREAVFELLLPSDKIPETWEPYYIAAQQKYGQRAGARDNFTLGWYKKLNRWLDLSEEVLAILGTAASQIAQRDVLYEWANFTRYLIYDTTIVKQNSDVMTDLTPKNALPPETEDLFPLLCLLAGADRSVKLYKDQGQEAQAEAAFGILGPLLHAYERHYHRWGVPRDEYILKLANASLYAFEELAFSLEKNKLPGTLYRNTRSGELVLLAKPAQLYDKQGRRVEEHEEKRIFRAISKAKPLIAEEQLQGEPEQLTVLPPLPEGIWETRFFATESGGFVGNELGADSFAKSSVRIFEAGHWKPVLGEEDFVLALHVADPLHMNRDRLLRAIKQVKQAFVGREGMPEVLVYKSCLLDPLLLQKIEGLPDLQAFAKVFRLFPVYPRRAEAYQKLFGEDVRRKPLHEWPEENAYQRAAKHLRAEGGEPGLVGGYALLEMLQTGEKTTKTEPS